MQEHSHTLHTLNCTARHSSRRLDPSYLYVRSLCFLLPAAAAALAPAPSRTADLCHLSRPKSRRRGTATFELFASYSAAAIKFDQLKSPGLSSDTSGLRSSATKCFTSSDTTMPVRPQRLCCTAPAPRFLATPKYGSISGSPHCRL
jgi:hypothetical protein